MRPLSRKIWNFTAGFIAVVVILLAVLVGIFRVVVDHVPEYKRQIETLASEAVGLQVTLESIDARMRFLGPELFFTGAVVHQDGADAPFLQAARGRISMDLIESLRERRLAPGRVILEGADLELKRDAEGGIALVGYTLPDAQTRAEFEIEQLPDGVFELRNSNLIIDDRARGGDRWTLSGLRIALEREADELDIVGNADLPGQLGGAIEFDFDVDGSLAEPAELSGRFFLEVSDAVFPGWRTTFAQAQHLPAEGGGDFAVWMFFTAGELTQVNARVDLSDVRLAAEDTMEYEGIAGRGEWERTSSGWNARVSDFRIARDGHRWPETQMKLEFTRQADASEVVIYADTNYLRLQDVAPFSRFLPDSQFRTDINQYSPAGEVADLILQFSGTEASPIFNIQANLTGISLQPGERTPGLDNLTAVLRASQSGGQLQIDSDDSVVDLPWLFTRAIPVDAMNGTVVWRDSGNAIRVVSDRFLMATKDGELEVNFDLNVPGDGAPAQIELQGFGTDMRVTGNIDPYLPTRIMSPAVVSWLQNAFRGGDIPRAEIQLSGPLNKFPFRNDEGLFRIEFDIRDSTLNYAENWPLITDLYANVVFENETLTIAGERARIVDTEASNLLARYDDLKTGVLKISADTAGTMENIHSFILQSPLIDKVGDSVPDMLFTGEGVAEIDMTIPVKDLAQTDVQLALQMKDVSLGLRGLPFRFDDLNGEFMLHNSVMDASGINGSFLGQPIVASIMVHPETRAPENDTLVVIHGVVEAESLIEGLDLPLQGRLFGKTDWRADARIPRRGQGRSRPFEILFQSSLTGMEVDLPAPLGKDDQTTIDLVARYRLRDNRASVDIDYDTNTNAVLFFERQDPGWRLYSGSVMMGGMDALPSNAAGLVVAGRMKNMVLEDWLSLVPEERGEFELQDMLYSVEVDIEDAQALGHRFTDLRLEMNQGADAWMINVDSELAKGGITFPFDLRAGGALQLKMDKLHLTDAIDEESDDPNPLAIPKLEIDIDDFSLAGRELGVISARVLPDETGVDITNIATRSDSLIMGGSGRWEITDSGQRTALRLECESTDVGATLASLTIPEGLAGESAYASIDVWWPGPPNSHFAEKISGSMSFNIANGILTEVNPGAGRLFGLLSVSALPRRLSLDFSDVFQKGLAFDSLGGDFQLFDGDAFTDSLALSGPAAKVLIVGRTGIAKRDYDQIAVVSTNIGRSLVIPGAFAAGPGVGAAVWLFSEIFKDPLTDISRVSYQITGSWDDPKIEEVEVDDQELAQGAAQ